MTGITETKRKTARKQAHYRCEYCHAPEVIGITMHLDHLNPQSAGGEHTLDNLCLACDRCNKSKSKFTTGVDPETQEEYPLFNPRTQSWSAHFQWSVDGVQIIGLTPLGRATIHRLKLNHETRQIMRAIWVKSGYYPPPPDEIS